MKETAMTKIQSDAEFRAALAGLSIQQQRAVGRLFIESVIDLSDDPVVRTALEHLDRTGLSASDLAEVFHSAKAAAVGSYTLCGREADWKHQAAHFVAAAVAACLSPEDQVRCEDLAWSTAMNARMARVCDSVADGCGTDECETDKQYEILSNYLATI
jgi:hypothetical protein